MSIRSAPAKIAVAGAAVLLLSGTAAAAATGSLPDPAQHAVSAALAHVSVTVPDPNEHADASVTGSAGGADHAPVGVDATGAAKHGLCTAWAARNRGDADRGKSADSTAFTNLRQAAHDQKMLVGQFCADELTTDDGATADPSGDHGRAGPDQNQAGPDHGQSGAEHGAPAGTPPVTTPNGGGIGTADGASTGAVATGADHADPRASAGSADAGARTGGSHVAP